MAGPKVRKTPTKPARTPAKKRSRTSVTSPSRNPEASPHEQSRSPKTPVRQRKRASEFASKKSSSKKRQRNQATPGKASTTQKSKDRKESTEDDGASVDEVIQQVRELMKSKSTNAKAKALAEALKRADEAFENDASGSSSGDDPADINIEAIDDAEDVIDEEGPIVNSSAKANGQKSEKISKQQKKRCRESQRTDRDKNPGKVSPTEEDSSSDDVDPGQHKAEIEALKRDDPMFYKFLEENDGSLLDFDMSDGSEVEGDAKGQQPDEEGDDSGCTDSDDAEGDTDIEDEKTIIENIPKNTPKRASKRDQEGEANGDLNKVGDVDMHDSDGEALPSDETDGDDSDSMKVTDPSAQVVRDVEATVQAKQDGKLHRDVDDVAGYSDDDDMSAELDAEAEAAAEAGLEIQEDSDSGPEVASDEQAKEPKKGKKKLIFVDMIYLRELKELLKSKRSSLKACKDLLRLFRAGRDILPSSPVSQDKKAKQTMTGKKSKKSAASKRGPELEMEDIDEDVYRDDGSFTSGKVRFASSKSYQQAMNLAIIGIQDALDKMLGKPQRKQGTIEPLEITWDPTDSGRWMNLEQIFRPYVFHLLALCDATEDASTLRFLLKRLEKLVPYTRENKVLLKKIARIALHVWSSDPHHISQMTRLRSYILLTRLAHGPGNTETVLRACCNTYSARVANVCNPKTLPLIHFATSCLVELFGIDMGASYTTAFSHLREMAISLRAVLVSKDRNQEVERIHNWSYINKLRLLSKVLGKYGREDELRPLIYPYVQISIGIMRVQPTPRTIPLRFHIASYLSDLTADTGVYIPVVPHLLSFLRCSELRKKGTHGTTSALEWRSILRVSDETFKTKPFLTGIIQGVVYQIAKFFTTISKHVSFPEVAHFAQVTLKKTAKELPVAQWRTSLTSLAEKIGQTSDVICDARSKADFSPHGAIHPDGMLAIVPGIDKERKMPIKRFFEVEQARVVKEERLRDEKQSEKKSGGENGTDAGDAGDEEEDGSDSNVEAEDSSEIEQEGPSKKRKTREGENVKRVVELCVPDVKDSDEEDDEIAELSLDSDESEEDE